MTNMCRILLMYNINTAIILTNWTQNIHFWELLHRLGADKLTMH